MKLSEFTINALKNIFSGDSTLTPYRSGPKLVDFFNRYGSKDVYNSQNGGLPNNASRNQYVVNKLIDFNGTNNLSKIILSLSDSRFYAEEPGSYDIDKVINEVNKLIIHDGYKLIEMSGAYLIEGEQLPDEIDVEVHFEDIQNQIIESLNSARFIIWVTVAWFTNKVLFDKLLEKKNQGLNIQVIILDDEINNKFGFDFESNFETIRFKKTGIFDNLMHNKFCIIDLRKVIHGSYNWTNKANYNKETISIETSKELAEKYAEEFIKIKNCKKTQTP